MNTIIDQKRTKSGLWRELRYDMTKPGDIARYFARNPYAWPGGYPLFAYTDDGGALCKECAKSEYYLIRTSVPGDGWRVIGVDVNYEDPDLYCDHCSNKIESAYG